jgi:mannose/cellobiose epimerase-like protein (N-acyl-D-glucosamine 2-epimerase family)
VARRRRPTLPGSPVGSSKTATGELLEDPLRRAGSELSEDRLRWAGSELNRWLVETAYPLWASRDFDRVHGGFHESLDGDPAARLWPQTERLKATVSLARLTRQSRYLFAADAAVAAPSRFLATPVPGLWHDWLTADGYFTPGRAPASSFYHIVCAIAELKAAWPA